MRGELRGIVSRDPREQSVQLIQLSQKPRRKLVHLAPQLGQLTWIQWHGISVAEKVAEAQQASQRFH